MPDADPLSPALGRDEPRHDATSPDQYTLTIDDALVRYEHAGHPRTARSIQRYCAKGHLDCLRQETTFGDKYLITPTSVARHIAQIDEIASATRRDQSRPAATLDAASIQHRAEIAPPPTSLDTARQDTTGRDASPKLDAREGEPAVPPQHERYVRQLERENDFLRDQIQRKDTQIGELSERARETNFLIRGLQNLVLQLQPGRPGAPRDALADDLPTAA